jgi:hypothetical protein
MTNEPASSNGSPLRAAVGITGRAHNDFKIVKHFRCDCGRTKPVGSLSPAICNFHNRARSGN